MEANVAFCDGFPCWFWPHNIQQYFENQQLFMFEGLNYLRKWAVFNNTGSSVNHYLYSVIASCSCYITFFFAFQLPNIKMHIWLLNSYVIPVNIKRLCFFSIYTVYTWSLLKTPDLWLANPYLGPSNEMSSSVYGCCSICQSNVSSSSWSSSLFWKSFPWPSLMSQPRNGSEKQMNQKRSFICR